MIRVVTNQLLIRDSHSKEKELSRKRVLGWYITDGRGLGTRAHEKALTLTWRCKTQNTPNGDTKTQKATSSR